VTNFDYYNTGDIKDVTLPDGLMLTYSYDQAHRLKMIVNNSNEAISYTRNDLGDITKVTVQSCCSVLTIAPKQRRRG